MIGSILGHYEILDKIGEGGMGEVYSARDTLLHRRVAIKILPPEMVENAERRTRFEREAQAIATLNHPNIVVLHSIEEADGIHFITMELVEGSSLSETIPAEGYPFDQLLEVALPITEAIAVAHARGIIHRDLKPENIIVGDDGRVRLLDFGLAKLRGEPAGEADAPYHTVALTEAGLILGTVTHMSPEQAVGHPVDQRSDLFSLGIILYQMATGRLPFSGDSQLSILSSILKDTPPDPTQVATSCPPTLGRIIMRCLAKEPTERYQTADDLIRDLKALTSEAGAVGLQESRTERIVIPSVKPISLKLLGISTAFIALGAVVVTLLIQPRPPSTGSLREQPFTSAPRMESTPSWDPAGSAFVYESNEDGDWNIYLRRLDATQPENLTAANAGADRQPAWSPDGNWIAYSSDERGGVLRIVSVTGDEGRDVFAIGESTPRYPRLTWSPDSERIAFIISNTLHICSHRDSAVERIPLPTDASRNAAWSPDGRWIAWNAMTGGSSTQALWLIQLDGHDIRQLTEGTYRDIQPGWSQEEKGLYFISDRSGSDDVYWIPIRNSGRSGRVRRLQIGDKIAAFDICEDPFRIAYSKSSKRGWIYSIPIDPGRTLYLPDATRHTEEQQYVEAVVVSPDRRWIAFNTDRNGSEQIWRMALDGTGRQNLLVDGYYGAAVTDWSPDGQNILFFARPKDNNRELYDMSLEEGTVRKLTLHEATDFWGRYSHDGTEIVFYSNRGGQYDLWLMPASGGEAERLMPPSAHARIMPLWSPDGRQIAFEQYLASGHRDIGIFNRDTGQSHRLTESEWGRIQPFCWSEDGSVIYGHAADGMGIPGRHIWAFSIPDGEATLLLDLRGTDLQPVTTISSDGKRLYFPLVEEIGDIWVKW
ncbi:protein kinase [Gemmatimonadota bacterium]